MDWENERYIRLYTRDTPEWLTLSWRARALFVLLLREVDRGGTLRLGQKVRSLAPLLRADWDQIEAPLKELLDDGCVVHRTDSGELHIPNFFAAQEATQSDAARARKYRELQRLKTPSPVVYFVQALDGVSDLIKIGFAKNLDLRLHSLRTGCPSELRLLGKISGDSDLEAELHARFAHLHVRGEWFRPGEDLLWHIQTLPGTP